jgi:hypothetical protein
MPVYSPSKSNTQSAPATKPSLVTAKQIEKPPVNEAAAVDVAALGSRIAAQLKTMRSYEAKARKKAGVELRKAQDNFDTITQLLAEAKAKCDGGGFKAFKKRYCPNLSRSRVYELLAIGSGKTTIEASRAATNARVANHRRQAFDRLEQVETSVTDEVMDKSPVEPTEERDRKTCIELNRKALDAERERAQWLVDHSAQRVTASPEISIEQRRAEHAALDLKQSGGTLDSIIEREWLEAERAFEALTAHTGAQVAQVIPPGKAALVAEIADYFTALADKLAACPAGNGEAPIAGSDYSIPDDLSIPHHLQRGA